MPKPLNSLRPPRLPAKPTKERHHYRTAEWRAKRLRILIRDSYRCLDCGIVCHGKAAHVDHIQPLELGGTDDDGNLACRCERCHGRKTRSEQRRRGVL